MTENKRFFKDRNEIITWIRDKKTWKKLKTDEEIVDLLNSLNDENEQLKKDCTALISHNQDYRKENEQLNQENSPSVSSC